MLVKATARKTRTEPGPAKAKRSGKRKDSLRHDLSNELAVVTGFSWLALSALHQLGEKLEGDRGAELQSVVAMVERIKSSADEARQLLAVHPGAIAAPAKARAHT